MQGKHKQAIARARPPSLEIRQERISLHSQISRAPKRNTMFLYHRRADPGVNLNFKQNQASAQVRPTCQYSVVLQGNYFLLFQNARHPSKTSMENEQSTCITFYSNESEAECYWHLSYSGKWWQMLQKPYKKAEPQCVTTSEIYSRKHV